MWWDFYKDLRGEASKSTEGRIYGALSLPCSTQLEPKQVTNEVRFGLRPD